MTLTLEPLNMLIKMLLDLIIYQDRKYLIKYQRCSMMVEIMCLWVNEACKTITKRSSVVKMEGGNKGLIYNPQYEI